MDFSYWATAISLSILVTLYANHVRASKIGIMICGAKLHANEPGLKSPDSSTLAVPAAPVRDDAGKESRTGGADIGVGRLELIFRSQDVRPV